MPGNHDHNACFSLVHWYLSPGTKESLTEMFCLFHTTEAEEEEEEEEEASKQQQNANFHE